jgi:cysteine desulfurase
MSADMEEGTPSARGSGTQQRVYLDYAATSPMLESVQRAVRAAETGAFGNPSSTHWAGEKAHEVLEAARAAILKRAGVGERVVFTSGASESNLLGLLGAALGTRAKRVAISAVEHESVFAAARVAKLLGLESCEIPVDSLGRVSLEVISQVVRDGPVAVAVMHANNEVGTLQPIAEIAPIVHAAGGVLHVDAVQSFGKLPLDELAEADTIALSAHKLGGPKGVGGLLIRQGVEMVSPFGGGSQEYGLRHGTENVPGIVGFARAAVDNDPVVVGPALRRRGIRLRAELAGQIPDIGWTGDLERRAPHIVSGIVAGVPGDLLVASLSALGVAFSVGSACHSSADGGSHVLKAMGASLDESACAIRLSVGLGTRDEEILYASAVLAEAVYKLRTILQSGEILDTVVVR